MGRGVRMAAIGTQTVGYVLAGWWLGGQLHPVWGEKAGALLGVAVGMATGKGMCGAQTDAEPTVDALHD